MRLFELVNPSDRYTFKAESIEIAGCAAVLLSSGFGATEIGGNGESTPVLFGWNEWLADRGIDKSFIDANAGRIADALDSFLIGGANERGDVESMLAALPSDEARDKWRAERQDRHRSSMNDIGSAAYALAKRLRDNMVVVK